MHLNTTAILLSARAHGEHGAVGRALTAEAGVQPGYVRGGRSRAIRPVLQPGNIVRGDWRARSDTQLAALSVELVESRAPLFAEPVPVSASLPEPAEPRRRIDPEKAAELAAILEKAQKSKRARKTVVDENQLTLFDFVA